MEHIAALKDLGRPSQTNDSIYFVHLIFNIIINHTTAIIKIIEFQ